MRINQLNVTKKEIVFDAGSIQRVTEESTSTKIGTYSRASTRRMRIESQSAQLRVEGQMAFNGDLPLNEENAIERLLYLDQLIAKASGEYSSIEVFGYTMEKLALHMYLGNTAEVVACLQELKKLDGTQPSSSEDDEDDLLIEGKTAHVLLDWAAGNGVDEVMELAKFPDPILLLLLKAKGMPLPEPADFSADDFLQIPGFRKAMLGDYEGALNELSDPSADEFLVIRGLIHFLNNDPEKARADLCPPCKEGMTVRDYWIEFLGTGSDVFSRFAIAKILDL